MNTKITILSDINTRQYGSPRNIINEDFKIDLPIKGGWGYTIGDAVIIDKNDETVSKVRPFDGVGIEYTFIDKRIFEELIVFRSKGDKIININKKLIKQSTIIEDGKNYDKLEYNIIGEHEKTLEKIEINRDFWFDITSFY